MNTKFTPGPWKFNAHDGSITDCTAAENEIAIVQIEDWDVLGMGYANAHLIAYAPDMYEMLDTLTDSSNTEDMLAVLIENKSEISELLKRARGE